MIHETPHKLAGQTVKVTTAAPLYGRTDTTVSFTVEDWWDRLDGRSWTLAHGNPAALGYAVRSSLCTLPFDDEVVYGKVDGLGHIVHVSELGEPERAE